jgi:hypothetical protein
MINTDALDRVIRKSSNVMLAAQCWHLESPRFRRFMMRAYSQIVAHYREELRNGSHLVRIPESGRDQSR